MKFSDFKLEKNSDGLLPVIVQDACTGKVLMLAYLTEAAFDKTVETGLVTFWSRSRGELWTKGETSGNYLHLEKMYPDCDADTLLVTVRPDGPACHRGTTSCFDTPEEEGFLGKLEDVVRERREQMPEGSYTSYLFTKGVNKAAQKVGEEAVETVIEAVAGNRDRYVYEASDLLYHLLVVNNIMGVSLDDLRRELLSRHK